MPGLDDGMSLLSQALRGGLSETEAVEGLVELGASEELLGKLGVSSEIHAGSGRVSDIVSWALKKYAGNRALLAGILAFFISSGQLYGYSVQKGDTLYGIAKQSGCTVDTIRVMNPQLSGDLIKPGMNVVVPSEVKQVAKAVAPQPAVSGGGSYEVVKGDTGYGIAKKLGISFKELRGLNPGVDLEHISPGQKLNTGKPAIDPKTDYLARVIYAETSTIATEEEVGLICRVIMNRVGRKGFPGNGDPHSIVSAPKQFSCTSGKDGNVNWKDYRKDLNSTTERDYRYAEKMMSGDTSWMGGDGNIVFYCNKSLATGKDAVGKVNWNDGGKTIQVGHPSGFGDVKPAYVTEHFVFYRK